MDVYLTDLRGLSDHATHQGRQAADLGEHAINQGRQAVDWAEHIPRPRRTGQDISREGVADVPSRKTFGHRECRITERFEGVGGCGRARSAYRPKPRVSYLFRTLMAC